MLGYEESSGGPTISRGEQRDLRAFVSHSKVIVGMCVQHEHANTDVAGARSASNGGGVY